MKRPEIWFIHSTTNPTCRRLGFKNDMTTLEKSLGWVAEQVNGKAITLPVREIKELA